MWPRSHTSGLISGECTRSRSQSEIEATSASVRSRASANAPVSASGSAVGTGEMAIGVPGVCPGLAYVTRSVAARLTISRSGNG